MRCSPMGRGLPQCGPPDHPRSILSTGPTDRVPCHLHLGGDRCPEPPGVSAVAAVRSARPSSGPIPASGHVSRLTGTVQVSAVSPTRGALGAAGESILLV